MSLSTALWIAGAVTLLVTVFIGEKIIDPDFSGLPPLRFLPSAPIRQIGTSAPKCSIGYAVLVP